MQDRKALGVGGTVMFCMKCGAELPNDAKFCFKCGARIEKEALNNNAEESVFQHKNQNTNVAAQKRTDNGSANWLILPLGKRKLRFPASMKNTARIIVSICS